MCLCDFIQLHFFFFFLLLIRSLLQSVPWFWKWFVSFYRCPLPCLEFRTLLTQLVEYHVDSVVGARGNGCGWPSCHCPGCQAAVFLGTECFRPAAVAVFWTQSARGPQTATKLWKGKGMLPLRWIEWSDLKCHRRSIRARTYVHAHTATQR